jgi:hypothetical protein
MKHFMNCLDTQFHMPNANDSLVIAIKLTTKYICTGRIFTLLTGSTALRFTAAGASLAARRIQILPMKQYA